MSVAIHWFRRDLRLTDNTALNAAAEAYAEVLPVYILSEWKGEHPWTGAPRQEFLCGCLAELAGKLEQIGSRLLVLQGRDQCNILERLVAQTGAKAIYFNRDPDPHGRNVEEQLHRLGKRLGVEIHGHHDHTLRQPQDVLTGESKPYKVFTAYARAWNRLPKEAPGKRLKRLTSPQGLQSLPIPTLDTWGLRSSATIIQPGEEAARRRWHAFLRKPVFEYSEQRDFPGRSGSSRISQDLRWGLLSIREIYADLQQATEAANADEKRSAALFLNELVWREFAFQILWHFPWVLDQEFLPQFRGLPWKEPGDCFQAWREGRTGFPIVDAGMRELAATGFMHNRARMIVAMFLTKDLHLSWKLGERHFMQSLVDGEIANNNLGWQWCASVGTDAQPYFRIQNPWAQTAKYDPDAAYIYRWVPELRGVPPSRLAKPPKTGERIARGYPMPIVDHAHERETTLQLFQDAAARYKAQL